jgi:putative ABC transport system substrate-binding protein
MSEVRKTLALRALLLALSFSGALLLALCFPAQAQQPAKVPRIGYLTATYLSAITARTEAFRQGLRDLGYVEGKRRD